MKNLIVLAFLSLITTSAVANDEDSIFGAMVKNRKNNEYVALKCASTECTSFNFFLLKGEGEKKTFIRSLNQNPLSKEQISAIGNVMNLRCRVPGRESMDGITASCSGLAPDVLPTMSINLGDSEVQTAGMGFTLTTKMWDSVDFWLGGDTRPGAIAGKVGAGLATPITGAIDLAAITVVDTGLIVSYPVRLILKSPRKNAPGGAKALSIMMSRQGDVTKLSSKNFERFVRYLSAY